MKFLLLQTVCLAVSASAVPALFLDSKQTPLDASREGFSLDLAEQRLVQLEGQAPQWVSEMDKIRLKAKGISFFDITDTQDLGHTAASRLQIKPSFPSPNATDQVKPVLKTLSTEGPKSNLKQFTSFRTRYYRSDTGKESQKWLLGQISEITAKWSSSSLRKKISISEFLHSWGQNSLIVKINGSSTTDKSVIVIGAHQDSTNMWPFLPAPGADDDGSGSVTILEAYRALIAADFHPIRTVEFHWYSAEEGGLLGSQAVARDYEARSVEVLAMSQFDMTAWVKRGTREEVGVITDFVDPSLTNFNKQLVETYLSIPYVETKCGYACSDHRIDISDEFSFEHMLEFSKLAVAFAIELGGWE
ncbi:hypothetical protein ONZ45_g16 [Pleurotus djamor]|nr:hypothetical protein ONZ45_g16 [Pleurotus djamor]